MISVYYFSSLILPHIALSVSGLGSHSFSISFYPSSFLIIPGLLVSPGYWRPVEYDVMEAEYAQIVHIPTLEDGNAIGLSESAMHDWLKTYQKTRPFFTGLKNNCMGMVVKALRASMNDLFIKSNNTFNDNLIQLFDEYQNNLSLYPDTKAAYNLVKDISKLIEQHSSKYGIDYLTGSSAKTINQYSPEVTSINEWLTRAWEVASSENEDCFQSMRLQIEMINKEKCIISPHFSALFYKLIVYIEDSKRKHSRNEHVFSRLQETRQYLQAAYDSNKSEFKETYEKARNCLKEG